MNKTLYAIFYKTNKTRHWWYYGAFTTLDMAQDLVEHIKRRPHNRATETNISVFTVAQEQEED